MKKVLIIDDDNELLELLSDVITEAQLEPIACPSGEEGLRAATTASPDLIVLDVHLPGINGFEVCEKLRALPATRLIPIIMLTTADDLEARVKGLELGADDYLPKPFHSKELIARIRARLRRSDLTEAEAKPIRLGNLSMDPRSLEVRIDNDPVRVTHFEFELLRYFVERPNQVIARAKLLGDLWPDSVVTDRTVDTHVANLRKKIRAMSCPLETVYGAGYILRAPEGSAAQTS